MSDTVIKVQNLFKEYRLGVVSHGTLRHDLASWWAKCRGKEDPNSLVTQLKKQNKNADQEELKQHFLAVNDVSFEVKQGDVLGIIGRNGAGKSTLLKILSRITSPSSGEIMINGRMASLLEVGTGFHPELTGRENVYMNGAILGMRKREVASKIDEIIAFSGIERFIDTPVKRFSSGMYVRLAFAVAAHLNSDILVLDEVLAVGDSQFQKKCLGKMDDVAKKQGRTVLFVSHNMDAVANLCTKTLWLEKGCLIEQGETSSIIEQYIQKLEADRPEMAIHSGAFNEFPVDITKPFQLLAVSLINEFGQTTDSFTSEDNIIIETTCRVNSANHGTVGYLLLYKGNNERFLESDSNDHLLNNLSSLPIGEHKIKILIPKRILGHGNYEVYLSYAPFPPTVHWDIPGIVCSFRVTDISRRGNNRNGKLSTLLDWRITG